MTVNELYEERRKNEKLEKEIQKRKNMEVSGKVQSLWRGILMVDLARIPPEMREQKIREYKLHFKTLVTSCGHLSGKIILPSYVKGNSSHYPYSMAYTLYFQKILGLPMIRRLET